MGKGVYTNLGHETNQLCSQNVKITYNTFTTRLGSMNTLVIGGTGEGKSRYIVRPLVYSMPTDPRKIPCRDENGNTIPILDAKGEPLLDEKGKVKVKMKNPNMSFVFTDPKGELCRDTAGVLKACGYKIKVFNLVDMKYSDCYNPFKYINYNSNPNQALTVLIDGLVDASQGGDKGGSKDPHWPNMAKAVLNSLAFYLFKEHKFEYQNFTQMSKLLPLFRLPEGETTAPIDNLLNACQNESLYTHPALEWRRKITAQGGELSSIISTAQASLRLWADSSVQKLTEFDTLDLDKIGDEPTAVYVITPTTNSTYDFLVATFYNQLFETLMYKANMVYHGGLPHHVLVVQDEFANTGKIPDYDKKIATFRSCNISSVIIVQSPNQIKSMYEGKAQDIVDNTHITIFLGNGGQSVGNDNASAADFVSRALGKTTVKTEGKSLSYQDQNSDKLFTTPNISSNVNVSQRDLMTPEEVRQLPADECIVMIKGYKPFRDKKTDLDSCLNYGSDLFTYVKPNGQRALKKEFDFSIEDNKATINNYKNGKNECPKLDVIQAKKWAEEYIEKCQFSVVGKEKYCYIVDLNIYDIKKLNNLFKRQSVIDDIMMAVNEMYDECFGIIDSDAVSEYLKGGSNITDSSINTDTTNTDNSVETPDTDSSSDSSVPERNEVSEAIFEKINNDTDEMEKKKQELMNSQKEEETKEKELDEESEKIKSANERFDALYSMMQKNKKVGSVKKRKIKDGEKTADKEIETQDNGLTAPTNSPDTIDESKSQLEPNFENYSHDIDVLNGKKQITIDGKEQNLIPDKNENLVEQQIISSGKNRYTGFSSINKRLEELIQKSKSNNPSDIKEIQDILTIDSEDVI